jgi:hypothetical protein
VDATVAAAAPQGLLWNKVTFFNHLPRQFDPTVEIRRWVVEKMPQVFQELAVATT